MESAGKCSGYHSGELHCVGDTFKEGIPDQHLPIDSIHVDKKLTSGAADPAAHVSRLSTKTVCVHSNSHLESVARQWIPCLSKINKKEVKAFLQDLENKHRFFNKVKENLTSHNGSNTAQTVSDRGLSSVKAVFENTCNVAASLYPEAMRAALLYADVFKPSEHELIEFSAAIKRRSISQLNRALDLLYAMYKTFDAIVHGEVPRSPLFYELLVEKCDSEDDLLENLDKRCKNLMETAGMLRSPVRLEIQTIDNAEDFNTSKKRVHSNQIAVGVVVKQTSTFSDFALFNQRFMEIVDHQLGINFLVTSEIARAMTGFFQDHGIVRVLDVFSGLGLFKAAMKSVDSPIEVVSLDNFSAHGAHSGYKRETIGNYSFFPKYDQDGVTIVKDSATYPRQKHDHILISCSNQDLI